MELPIGEFQLVLSIGSAVQSLSHVSRQCILETRVFVLQAFTHDFESTSVTRHLQQLLHALLL